MLNKLYHLLCITLVLSGLSAVAFAEGDPTNPPQGVFSDEWYVLMFGGQHAGYIHSTMERQGDRMKSSEVMMMALTRGGRTIEIKITTSGTESLSGRPLAFEARTKLAAAEMQVRGEIVGEKVKVRSTQFGVTTEEELDLPQGALMGWGLRLVALEHGFEPGTRYSVKAYVPSQSPGAAVPTTIEIIGPEPLELFGKKYQAIKSKSTMIIGGTEVASDFWSDEQGEVLRADQQMMGVTMQQLRADRERALGGGASAELMLDTLVRPDRRIDADQARRVKYRLTLSKGDETLSSLPSTGLQKVVSSSSTRSIELIVQRQDHAVLARSAARVSNYSSAFDEYLAAGPIINWQDPEVKKMAADAKGDEANAYRLADKLRRYVTDAVDDKNLDIGFATASEVARNREGDCSEHGVLLAALGRANGIPSRVAAGLVYVEQFLGQKGVFGFHMWTQMYIDGRWVDLDAAMSETDCNPTHIAVAVSSLQDEGLMELVGPLLKVIGNLKIEVLEVKP